MDVNPVTATAHGLMDGEWVLVEKLFGSITLKAKLNDGIEADVVCTQNGWWQACPELDLPGYDPNSPKGANINLLFDIEEKDPISGSIHLKGYPFNVKKTG